MERRAPHPLFEPPSSSYFFSSTCSSSSSSCLFARDVSVFFFFFGLFFFFFFFFLVLFFFFFFFFFVLFFFLCFFFVFFFLFSGCCVDAVVVAAMEGIHIRMILVRGIADGPYHPPLWRCHSTDAKQAKCNRGAPYIYWGYSRWAVASTIVALSQHGSKAGSNDMPGNGTSFAHAGPESNGKAAVDCRCAGCIRHRFTLAHQDRPKPQQGQVA